MNRHSTGSKKFNFNDIDQQSQLSCEAMPVEKEKSRKSKRSYNFSLINDSDDDTLQVHTDKAIKTAGRLHSSQKQALVQETAEEEAYEGIPPTGEYSEKERKLQQEERNKQFTESLLTAILSSDQDKVLNDLLQQVQQNKELTIFQTNTLAFLLLKKSLSSPSSYCVEEDYAGVIKSKVPVDIDELTSLKRWGVYSLRMMGEEVAKIAQKRKAPKRLGKLAEHRIKQLAKEFELANNYDDCLTICSLEDYTFRDSYQFCSSREIRNQLNIISAGTLKAIPHTAWLVDLSLALLYFDPIPLAELLKDLNKKYAKTLQPFMVPHILLLNLERGNQPSIKDTIVQIISNSPNSLQQLNQILFMWTLNSHRGRVPDLFQSAVQSVIRLIRSPNLFVDFLCYLRLGTEKVKAYFDFFLKQNSFLKSNRDEKIEQMKEHITNRRSGKEVSSFDGQTIQILVKWVKCESFLHQSDKIESIRYLTANYEWISSPVIHSSAEVHLAMVDSLLTFEVLCIYKAQQKRDLVELLEKLAHILEEGKQKHLVKGIIAFIQLKSKVFWLFNHSKFKDFQLVFTTLEERQAGGDGHAKRIKANMIKALSNALESFQGKLFLQELASRYEKPLLISIAKYIDSPDTKELRGEDRHLLLNPFIRLADMLKTVPKFTRKLVANLLL